MLQIDSIFQFGSRDDDGSIYTWHVVSLSGSLCVRYWNSSEDPVYQVLLGAQIPLSSMDPQKPRKEVVQPKSASRTAWSNPGRRLCIEYDVLKQDVPLSATQVTRAQIGEGETDLQASQDVHPQDNPTTSHVL